MSSASVVDRRLRIDVGIACFVPALQLVLLAVGGSFRPWTAADALTIGLVLIQGVPLAARRSRPWPVFAVVLAANSLYYALGLPPSGYDLGLAVALFTVAEQRPLRSAVLAYGIVVAETLIMKLLAVGPYWSAAPWFLVTYLWVFFGAAWIFGRYQRVRAQRMRDVVINAERERVAAADAAVRAERLRIARELHDVVAHHLSLMTIQASGARRLIGREPERASEALAIIEEYGRRGLDAMPGLLRALRTETGPDDLDPSPRLADLEARVVDPLRRSGLAVTVSTQGELRRLPDAVELSAYRIAQESLTNVVRHAGSAAVSVEFDYRRDGLLVVVADDGVGPRASQNAAGHGITGMRERALVLGGTFEAGGGPDRGFRVRAWLPGAGSTP